MGSLLLLSIGGIGFGLCFNAALVFSLIQADCLFNQSIIGSGTANNGHIIFNILVETTIEVEGKCFFVELKGEGNSSEFHVIGSSCFGLVEGIELVFAQFLVILVEVDIGYSGFESGVIIPKGVILVFTNISCPRES